MRVADRWQDYQILDTSGGEKLERWGQITLIRPDPQIIWNTPKGDEWRRANARYNRSKSGGGSWQMNHMPKEEWDITYGDLKFRITVGDDAYETVLGIKDIPVTIGGVQQKINAWEPGKKYVYTLTITKTGVTVTATIADWDTVTADTPIWM